MQCYQVHYCTCRKIWCTSV